jgi:hypothetical protein
MKYVYELMMKYVIIVAFLFFPQIPRMVRIIIIPIIGPIVRVVVMVQHWMWMEIPSWVLWKKYDQWVAHQLVGVQIEDD